MPHQAFGVATLRLHRWLLRSFSCVLCQLLRRYGDIDYRCDCIVGGLLTHEYTFARMSFRSAFTEKMYKVFTRMFLQTPFPKGTEEQRRAGSWTYRGRTFARDIRRTAASFQCQMTAAPDTCFHQRMFAWASGHEFLPVKGFELRRAVFEEYTGQPPRDKTRHVMNGCDTSQAGGITWRRLGSTEED